MTPDRSDFRKLPKDQIGYLSHKGKPTVLIRGAIFPPGSELIVEGVPDERLLITDCEFDSGSPQSIGMAVSEGVTEIGKPVNGKESQ